MNPGGKGANQAVAAARLGGFVTFVTSLGNDMYADILKNHFKKENIFFCGDFIFYESIGRCDLPTGDYKIMKESLNKIKNYPLDMLIYPGHGRETTLEYEIENNIYFSEV